MVKSQGVSTKHVLSRSKGKTEVKTRENARRTEGGFGSIVSLPGPRGGCGLDANDPPLALSLARKTSSDETEAGVRQNTSDREKKF